ncbi:MAG: serine hydrolase [Reyranella sp.]|nr:serine hydrolase [Reyranella sp.]
MQRLSKALLAILLATAALLCTLPATAQEKPLTWPAREWPLSSPEAEGMSSQSLADLVAFGAANAMDSLLVTRHGRIVLDATYAPFQAGLKHRIYSSTKSVTATLIALAIRDGKLDSTDRKVVDFFPELAIANLDDAKKAITIRHLLDMTSGLDWDEGVNGGFATYVAMERSPNWVQFILDRPMAAVPGTVFYYNTGNSHLLSAILGKVTGRSALDYARETLFGPLGIEDVRWRADPQGISGGGNGLYLKPGDMAKFGYLYLRNGQWAGKQIVPASWVDAVRAANIDMKESWSTRLRYGSQFWVIPSKDVFMAVGLRRQLIVVMPKHDIVVVATGSAHFPSRGGLNTGGGAFSPTYGFETLVARIEAAVKSDTALPPDPPATVALAERLREATQDKPAPVGGSSDLAKTISGRTYKLDPNPLNVTSLTLKFDGLQGSFEYEIGDRQTVAPPGRYGGPIGLDGHYRIGGRLIFGPSAARGGWLADGTTLVTEVQTLGNDDASRLTYAFSGKTVELDIEWAAGYPRMKLRGQADD